MQLPSPQQCSARCSACAVSNASFSPQQLSACRKAGEVSKHNPNPSASRHWAGNEEIGALGADRGPGWISFLESLADLEIPHLACWELQARCTKGLDGVGKTSVAQVDRSGSRVQKPIIASGQQRSPDAYEVQCSTVQSTLLRTAFQLPTGPMCCHDINPTFSPSILFHPSFSQRR
jgi:hypothetical protein